MRICLAGGARHYSSARGAGAGEEGGRGILFGPAKTVKHIAQHCVLQAERDTIAEREALEREEEEAAARETARLAERKVETHQIVVERVALEEAAMRAAAQVRVWGFTVPVRGK